MDAKFLMCKKCGSTITFLTGEGDNVKCCGDEMVRLHASETDGAKEKHVPKVHRIEGAVRVDVGEVSHPMEDEHFIEWIYLPVSYTHLDVYKRQIHDCHLLL